MKLLSVVALVALAAPAYVEAVPQAPAPTPAPATQLPATPAQPPAAPAEPPPVPARLPFPPGATHAYVDLQRVANESLEGRLANQRVQAAFEEKATVIEGRQLELQGSQQKLRQNATVMSAEAQLQLQREIERLTIEVERLSQDADSEVAELQQTLQLEFQQRLVPAIDRVAASRGLQFIFSAGDGGLIWANPALDVTSDVVEELNKAGQQTP